MLFPVLSTVYQLFTTVIVFNLKKIKLAQKSRYNYKYDVFCTDCVLGLYAWSTLIQATHIKTAHFSQCSFQVAVPPIVSLFRVIQGREEISLLESFLKKKRGDQ